MSQQAPLLVQWPTGWKGYELMDSGNGMRLERYGPYTLARPEPHALWQPRLSKEWEQADARFERFNDLPEGQGQWLKRRQIEEPWEMRYESLRFQVRLTPFKHTGFFPEQAVNWAWCADLIRQRRGEVRVLNLFGYTGLATLSAAAAGAKVTHVDASRPAMTWARANQELSGLQDKPIRWLIDDVMKFDTREVRRHAQYEGVILDPPAFGRGPKGEIWRFSDSFPELMQLVGQLLGERPLFVLVNAYAISDSATVLQNMLADTMARYQGTLEAGELALREQSGGRLLSTSIFARWAG
jgi:23S rRNA (cytosine1962-C5)-methyltransferase